MTAWAKEIETKKQSPSRYPGARQQSRGIAFGKQSLRRSPQYQRLANRCVRPFHARTRAGEATCDVNRLRNSVAVSGASREALQMKMKIFHSADWGMLEQTISEWLKKERVNRLLCVTHTNHEATMFITVWWK